LLAVLEVHEADNYLQLIARDLVEAGTHIYIIRSKNDIGTNNVVAAKISSAKG